MTEEAYPMQENRQPMGPLLIVAQDVRSAAGTQQIAPGVSAEKKKARRVPGT